VPDWEKDSLRLNDNLVAVLKLAAFAAERREIPTLTAARNWHKRMNRGLVVPRARFVGAFRGEPGLERIHVRVGSRYGAKPADVAKELNEFEARLQAIVSELDANLPSHVRLSQDHLGAVIDVCAWVHSEWVRIHPFVNGNGRTARLWANSIAMRYDLPPFSFCVQGRAHAMPQLRLRLCRVIGVWLPLFFESCSTIFRAVSSYPQRVKPTGQDAGKYLPGRSVSSFLALTHPNR
jgi:fido (protein-threonine AMPylation protein)